MSKRDVGDFNDYNKILADNLSLLGSNGSRQTLVESIEMLKGRIYSHSAELVKLQSDVSMDVTGNYKPEYDKIFGSREALDLENNKIKGINDNFTKLLINLDTLSKNISQKKNPEASLNEFRANIGVAPEVKPSIFQRFQTFVVDLFTNGQSKKAKAAVQNLNNSLTDLIAESDKAKAPIQEKITRFNEQNIEQVKRVQQDASLSNNLPPPPSTLPPLPSASLSEPPSRDVPPIPGQFSGRTEDLPPPPQFGPPTDLPPPLPPEFGGPPTDLPPPLPLDLVSPPINLEKEDQIARNSGDKLKDMLGKYSVDSAGSLKSWDDNTPQKAQDSEDLSKNKNEKVVNVDLHNELMSGLAKRRGGIAGDDELDLDNDMDSEDAPEKVQEKIENPPLDQAKSKSVAPPPPGLKPVKLESSSPAAGNTPSKPVLEKSNLLDQIRSGGMVLKSAGSRSNPLDQGEFKYSEIQKKSGMEAMLGGEYDAPALVNGKDKSQQMNALYSAIVEGNIKLTKELVDITVEVKTGKTIEDDWGDIVPVTENKKVYTKNDLEKIYSAVKSLDSKEGLSKVQKINIERGLVEVGKAAGVNVGGMGQG